MFKVAWAGLLRYRKRRKNLTIALIFTFAVLYFFFSFFRTINANLTEYWITNLTGGDIVSLKDNRAIDLLTPIAADSYFSPEDFLEKNPKYKDAFSGRLRVSALAGGIIEGVEKTIPIVMIGMDTEQEKRLGFTLPVKDGRVCEPGAHEIVISETVAMNIGVSINQELAFYVQTIDGYMNACLVKVAGFTRPTSGSFLFGNNLGFMDLPVLQALLATDKVSEGLVRSGAGFAAGNPGKGFRLTDGVNVVSVSRSVHLAYLFMEIIIIILISIFSFGIVFQNLTITLDERRREISVYLVYGAKPFWIQRLLNIELILYTTYTSLWGFLTVGALILILNTAGIYPIDLVTEILLGGEKFVMELSFTLFIQTWGILTLFALVGAFIPMVRSVNSKEITALFRNL